MFTIFFYHRVSSGATRVWIHLLVARSRTMSLWRGVLLWTMPSQAKINLQSIYYILYAQCGWWSFLCSASWIIMMVLLHSSYCIPYIQHNDDDDDDDQHDDGVRRRQLGWLPHRSLYAPLCQHHRYNTLQCSQVPQLNCTKVEVGEPD